MSIEIGAKLPGKISGITSFGAFVELAEGKTGLVHISEVSNSFIKDINEVLTVGDEVMVKVTSVGEDGKVGLSIRKAQEKPKESKYPQANREQRVAPRRNPIQAQQTAHREPNFEQLVESFLSESSAQLASLRKNTEGKRGGRGGRRGK